MLSEGITLSEGAGMGGVMLSEGAGMLAEGIPLPDG
jgi:hypothetical protein